jgi:hypothetical protein
MVEGAFVDVDLQSRSLPKETQNVKDGKSFLFYRI